MHRILIIGEDDYHTNIIPIFINKIYSKNIKCIKRKARNKGNVIKKYAEMLKEFKRVKINKALIIIDQDGDCIKYDADKLRKQSGVKQYNFAIKFHIIQREIETWLIADHEAVSKVGKKKMSRVTGNLEQINNPKEILIKNLKEKVAYTSQIACKIATEADIKIIESRCPGFKRFKNSVLDC